MWPIFTILILRMAKNRKRNNTVNIHSIINENDVEMSNKLTRLKMNLASNRPLLSTTGRRRCSLPF